MDHAYFGLQEGLFGDGIATDMAVFRSLKHDRVIAHFKLALDSPNSVVVLRGPPGIGKTTLTAAALRASSTRLALAWINGMPTNATELLELVLVELGVNTVRTTRMERLQLWRQFQGEMRATDSRLFVVVERTEDLSPEVLHALDQLTAPDAVGNPGANVVLLGHATIDEHLAAPLLDSLRQRIRVRAELTPFTEAELQDYLRHQVACAGGHYDLIFAPGTVAALHRYSGGVARLANTLCKSALDIAASQKQKPLTPELVTKTAVSLLGLAEATPPGRVAVPAPSREAAPVATHAPAAPPAAATAPIAPVAVAVAPAAAPLTPPVALATPAPVVVTAAPLPPPSPAPSAQSPNTVIPAAAFVVASVAAPIPPAAVAAAPDSARAPTPTPVTRTTAVPAAPAAKPISVSFEFDGGATDISDVAVADFPVLTDAVEPTTAAPTRGAAPAAPPQPEPAPSTSRAAAPKPSPAPHAQAPTLQPGAASLSRVETAYTAPRAPATPPPPRPAAAAPPAAAAAAPKPAAPPRTPPPAPADEDDLLRQTQTMRAIGAAKSIDDISSSMAETLFGDAELDLVTAALASAAEWPDDDEQTIPAAGMAEPPKPAAKPAAKAAPAPEPAKPAAPADDPFDLFGLGDDAPLELIDDSTLPPVKSKSAGR
jgi:type II secretory pathway predicted ATPase ExeA